MRDNKTIVEALKTIKEVCEEHTHCGNCPFHTNKCIIQNVCPDDWNILESPPKVWKAFY